MSGKAQLFLGSLDLLILKAVSLAPLHGYGFLLRIQEETEGWNPIAAAMASALTTRPEEI
jgi:DNA-binding PadR family transcriptional regulator